MIEPKHTTVQAIYAATVRDDDNKLRPHLGASLIGEACERRLWYGFHWVFKEGATVDSPPEEIADWGRMLRLFGTGHAEEARFVSALRAAGVEVVDVDENGKQHRVSDHGGHFAGSLDGVARGIIEAPKAWHVAEFKTHSEKSFNDLKKHGVKKSKPRHWIQMNTYMGYTEIDRAFYMAKNKNTDELYCERVEFDAVEFARTKAKALRIIQAEEPPLRISTDPTRFECKYCDFSEICHGNKKPLVNCRTCMHSTPVVDSSSDQKWHCRIHNDHVPEDFQRQGCDSHRYIPVFLEPQAQAIDFRDNVVVYVVGDKSFANGDGTGGTLTSADIAKAEDLSILPDLVELRQDFPNAKVVA